MLTNYTNMKLPFSPLSEKYDPSLCFSHEAPSFTGIISLSGSLAIYKDTKEACILFLILLQSTIIISQMNSTNSILETLILAFQDGYFPAWISGSLFNGDVTMKLI